MLLGHQDCRNAATRTDFTGAMGRVAQRSQNKLGRRSRIFQHFISALAFHLETQGRRVLRRLPTDPTCRAQRRPGRRRRHERAEIQNLEGFQNVLPEDVPLTRGRPCLCNMARFRR